MVEEEIVEEEEETKAEYSEAIEEVAEGSTTEGQDEALQEAAEETVDTAMEGGEMEEEEDMGKLFLCHRACRLRTTSLDLTVVFFVFQIGIGMNSHMSMMMTIMRPSTGPIMIGTLYGVNMRKFRGPIMSDGQKLPKMMTQPGFCSLHTTVAKICLTKMRRT